MYAFIGMPGPMEMTIILIIAVLLFGKRLPGVAKSFGQSITEFKKGIKEIEEPVKEAGKELNDATREAAREANKKV
jgi:sec-independent protein translocase protein TatA